MSGRVFIALGANLPHPEFGAPAQTMAAALDMLAEAGVGILQRSSWWQSRPVPDSGQPDFVNAVVAVNSPLAPALLLGLLHQIEARCGRVRTQRWAARTLDLDLVDYAGRVTAGEDGGPDLPHPRVAERLFVLLPLQEIEPLWRHPVTGRRIADLIAGAESININKL